MPSDGIPSLFGRHERVKKLDPAHLGMSDPADSRLHYRESEDEGAEDKG